MKTRLIFITLFIIGFLLLLSLYGFFQALYPQKLYSHITPADLGAKFEKISVTTDDNVQISGWFIPSTKSNAKTILLLHGYPADKGDILRSRLFLQNEFNLVFIDFRFLGESQGAYSTFGIYEYKDVLATIAYLKKRGINEIGVWGFSTGASVALLTAEKTNAIKAIVAESPFARLDWLASDFYRWPVLQYPLSYLTRFWAWLFFRVDISSVSVLPAVEKLRIPILLIFSNDDAVISLKHSSAIQKALQANPFAKVIVEEQAPHGAAANKYQQRIREFFDKNLL